ncbi:restriction endonuclease subunit S [Helicobacter sp. MIT 05-5293]|uniref:restriction endonuclease subunit S n=1 Tax=Helicobacter sp. MIT 05-5293 TaxID=1548149 RepID=UPI0010FD1FE7|nr:restriction endonuclease subunit S [Helicobacter sp. MIT 05-5293]TLD80880.1 restriction endonuclease subunit S [Helicobacter sp. MIT 05-5293]
MGQSFSVNFFESLHKEEWREVRLGEICLKVDYGYTASAIAQNTGTKFLRITDIVPSQIDWNAVPYCNIDSKSLEKYLLKVGDIVIARTGATAGYNKYIKTKTQCIFASYLIRFRANPNIANPHFISYCLQDRGWIEFVNGALGGSAQPNINAKQMSDFTFKLPPLPIQNQIAEILSSFDDKIDLLHRQNQTLESLALTLVRHHFIENPNRNEWKIGKLGDYGKIVCGKTPSKMKKEYFNGGIPFVKIPDMHNKTFVFKTTDSLTQKGLQSQHTKTLPPLSICVSCIATVGVVSMNAFESQTNQQINSIIPAQEYYRYFLYCFMKESYNELQAMASGGTATANLNTTDFSNMPILCPDDMELQKFHSLVSVYFDKIYNNSKQIQSLEQMRDLVLSKIFNEKMEE